MGNSATRILTVAVALADLSSVLAACMSMCAGYGIIPHLSIAKDAESLRELPEVVFQLDIPQIMPVMSALVFSVLILVLAINSGFWTVMADEADILILTEGRTNWNFTEEEVAEDDLTTILEK